VIRLEFDLKPLAKQSFKTTKTGHSYQPKDIVDFKNAVRWIARAQAPQLSQSDKPFHVELVFSFRRPESTKKPLKTQIDEFNALVVKTTKPDVDNLTKAILDALNGIIWIDDAQVCELHVTKGIGKQDKIIVIATELTNPVLIKLEY
jgi:Holliday junction resolvase RusA-like endonuclease